MAARETRVSQNSRADKNGVPRRRRPTASVRERGQATFAAARGALLPLLPIARARPRRSAREKRGILTERAVGASAANPGEEKRSPQRERARSIHRVNRRRKCASKGRCSNSGARLAKDAQTPRPKGARRCARPSHRRAQRGDSIVGGIVAAKPVINSRAPPPRLRRVVAANARACVRASTPFSRSAA